jgi:hypothetical protein
MFPKRKVYGKESALFLTNALASNMVLRREFIINAMPAATPSTQMK